MFADLRLFQILTANPQMFAVVFFNPQTKMSFRNLRTGLRKCPALTNMQVAMVDAKQLPKLLGLARRKKNVEGATIDYLAVPHFL